MNGAPPFRVVIVGAGFGGMEAARALSRAPARVTLLDRQNHHLFQPLLYQVATAALPPGAIAWPLRSVFRRQRNVSVLMDAATGLDLPARVVRTASGAALPFDALVLATGSTHSYFGNDEWAAHAPGLKTLDDAAEMRRRLLLAFERAELTEDAEERARLLTFVVVGGGPTGVELAGALLELAHHAMPGEFRRFAPESARIVLVEAGPCLLAGFPRELGEEARRVLERRGVEIRFEAAVTACDAGGVTAGGERIPAGTVVWGAGVAATEPASWLDTERDEAGRVVVGPDLAVPSHPHVFVVGDLAAATDAKGREVPGVAPAAKQMGRHAGRVIAARAAGRPAPDGFRYRDFGKLATIGRRAAVVDIRGFRLRGWVGWWFWGIAHVFFLIGFRSRVVVSFEWLWNLLTRQRGARLITGHHETGHRETGLQETSLRERD